MSNIEIFFALWTPIFIAFPLYLISHILRKIEDKL